MNLLQQLSALQEEHGWLSEEVLRQFSTEAGVPLYRIQEVASFYPHYRLAPPPKAHVTVCRDAACHIRGAAAYKQAIEGALANDEDIHVEAVSCVGRCEHAPAACVDDVPMLGLDAAAVVSAARGETPLPPDEPTDTPRRWASDPHESRAEHYAVLRNVLDQLDTARDEVPGILRDAGLRGMGGAGFPTGMKWQFVRDAEASDGVKYAVVNADESEPGTFKDRVILEELPHLVIEGLLIGCAVIGATQAYVFIRHEYGREGKAIQREIDRVREMGLLERIGCELELFVSPGGYILGEETALIEALEGKRGEPRNKPPYPTNHGVHGKPTLMNNVETFHYVPLILREGAQAWKDRGLGEATGLKFLSLCGDVEEPGVYCVPMGTSLLDFVNEQGGGMQDGKAMKAFCPGGASAPFLPADRADTPLDFGPMQKAGSMLGSGAVLVIAEGTDMLDLAANVVRFFRNESCGKCVPCRVGSEKAVRLMDRVLDGTGNGSEFDIFPQLDETLRMTSICGLGHVVLNPATSVLEHFPEDVARHTQSGA